MGTSSGLIHHYFATMDDVLAAAFERVAGGGPRRRRRLSSRRPAIRVPSSAASCQLYAPVGEDWAFQLWLDAWAEAARRPALREVSRRFNLAWAGLLERAIRDGVADGSFRSTDPTGAAWRILSVIDGLALQVVAHADDRRPAAHARLGRDGSGARAVAPPWRARRLTDWLRDLALDRARGEDDEEQGDTGEHEQVELDDARAGRRP